MSMVWISGQTVSSATTGINFTSIPQTFSHLQFRVNASTNSSTDSITMYGFDNTGGSSNSAVHTLYGNGVSALAANGTGQYNPTITQLPATSTSQRGSVIVDILDYTSTNKYKTIRSLGGYDGNGSGYIALTSVLPFGFGSSTALSSVWFYVANSFSVGSRIDLYGITTSQVTGA